MVLRLGGGKEAHLEFLLERDPFLPFPFDLNNFPELLPMTFINAKGIILDNYIHTHTHVYILPIHIIKVYTHLLIHNDRNELTVEKAFPKKLIMGFTFRITFKKHPVCCLPQAELEIVSTLKPPFPSYFSGNGIT